MRLTVFLSYVPSDLPATTCWPWRGEVRTYENAPPRPRYAGQWAHRVAYEHFVGPIPEGLEIDHHCVNTLCVNPAHLEPVTRAENMRRRSMRQTECKHGHEFTPGNTYIWRDPVTGQTSRTCRACNAAAQRRRRPMVVAG